TASISTWAKIRWASTSDGRSSVTKVRCPGISQYCSTAPVVPVAFLGAPPHRRTDPPPSILKDPSTLKQGSQTYLRHLVQGEGPPYRRYLDPIVNPCCEC